MEILRCELGEGYITWEHLLSFAGSGGNDTRAVDGKLGLVAVDTDRRRVLGVVLCEIVSLELLEQSLRGFAESLPRADMFRLRNSRTGFLESIAVDVQYRRRGIATSLIRVAMDSLRNSGIGDFYGLAWKRPDGSCPTKSMLASLGLEALAELPGFWEAESEAKGYTCPICGNPCECAAVVMCTTVPAQGRAPSTNSE